jgi:predicted nucleotidyltransferase
VTTRLHYYRLEEQLRAQGFRNDTREGAPVCRWLKDDLVLDVMPTDGSIIGFSNRWYSEAFSHARTFPLSNEVTIRVVTAPYFLATKLEAFRDRGQNDYLASRDLEDIITVVDGREELLREVAGSSLELRSFIAEEIQALLNTELFLDALPGHMLPDAASQQRVDLVLDRLRVLA